jgi:hypothetical protein
MTEKEGKKEDGTIEAEFERLFDEFLGQAAKPACDRPEAAEDPCDADDADDEGRATPVMSRPGSPKQTSETGETPGEDPENFGDRATPVLSKPPAPVEATVPAPHVDVKELFRMSGAPSNPPVTEIAEQVKEVAAVVMREHPSLKPSPVPRVYLNGQPETAAPPLVLPVIENIPVPPKQLDELDDPCDNVQDNPDKLEFFPPEDPPGPEAASDSPEATPVADASSAGPEIQVTAEEEVDEEEFLKANMTPEEIRKKLDQCLFLYREMNIDFSRVFEEILGFKKDGKYLAAVQVQHVIHCFLKHMTELLAKHLIEGKTNIIQTKTGHLAGKLMHKAAHVRNGRVECDGATLLRFQRIQELVEEIPEHTGIWQLTDDFIASRDLNALFQV